MREFSRRSLTVLTILAPLMAVLAAGAAIAQPGSRPAASPAAAPATAPPAAGAPATGSPTPTPGATTVPPATPAPAAEDTPLPATGDAQYEARLRQIEERVVGIKERIFQTKTRLLLLKEQILDNVIAESRAVLVHKNEMGTFFELQSVLYYLDGKKIYYQDNVNGLLDKRKEFEIYNGSVIPGNHALTVEMVYRGNSELFSYLEGYVFKLKSSYTFYAARGRVTEVAVVGYERGGVGTDLEDKPYIKYEVKQIQNRNAKPDAGIEPAK